jgi:alpha-D-ribose 1-methylphosphonate 5-triphosphate synthase subunit PhnH
MSKNGYMRGFSDPVHDTQQNFRLILQAMSEPGTAVQLAGVSAIDVMAPAAVIFCLTLLDRDTSLWLSPLLNTEDVRRNLSFHTGVTLTSLGEKAHFAVAYQDELDSLSGFPHGSEEFPESGMTLLLQTRVQQKDKPVTLRLTGPGIETESKVTIGHMEDWVLDYLIERPDVFPLGIDIVWIDGERLMCIPRTTLVERLER